MSERTVQNVWLRMLAALALVGALSVASFGLLSQLIARQEAAAPTINLSGRQRMLSQRIATFAVGLAHETDRTRRSTARTALEDAIALMRTSHEALTHGDAARRISADLSPELRDLYFGAGELDAMVEAFLGHAASVAVNPSVGRDDPDLEQLLALASEPLLRGLDAAVGQYEAESAREVERLADYALLVLVATLALLLAEVVVLWPIARELRDHVTHILATDARLRDRDRAMQQVLDSTGDALLSVRPDGTILPERSNAFGTWFGTPEPDQRLWELLFWRRDDADAAMMSVGFDQLASGALPIDVALAQLPTRFERGTRTFDVAYRPTLDERGDVTAVLVAIKDATGELERLRVERTMKEVYAVSRKLMRDPAAFRLFVDEAGALVDSLEESACDRTRLLRTLHTVKGSAASWGLEELVAVVHEAESEVLFEEAQTHPSVAPSIRNTWNATLARLDVFLDDGADADIVQIFRAEYEAFLQSVECNAKYAPLAKQVRTWTQEHVARPGGHILRVAEALALRQGKQVIIDLHGGEHRLPRERFGPVWQALVHIARNAVDHGIEASEDRRARGKPAAGRIVLSVRRIGDEIELRICDDGRGIQWDRLRAKAHERGLPYETDDERVAALFAPGVTSREVVTAISGRGMGTATMYEAVQELGGTCEVESEPGRGTTFIFTLPVEGTHVRAA